MPAPAEAKLGATSSFTVDFATKADAPTILSFIEQLAEYEKLTHECVATVALIEETIFRENPCARVLIARSQPQGTPVGFALFFYDYSTFLTRPGIHLEDLFVVPEVRGQGVGQLLLTRLTEIAKEEKCARMEWTVLDWNEPAIKFYKKFGADLLTDWRICRMSEAKMMAVGKSADVVLKPPQETTTTTATTEAL